MCVDTYSLSCIHFLLWTLIDSFVWNEIVHDISFGISWWYHQYDAYSTAARWSRVTFCIYPGLPGVACSPILSVSFEGMGCAPVLNLSATPDEAVSIICTIVDKTYFKLLGESWCMWAILLIGQCFSRASCRCSSYNLLLGSFNMVDLCLWDALSRWHNSWRVFTPLMCIPIVLDWAHQLMYLHDQLLIVISSSSMLAMLFWTIKALVEAEVLWWLYSNLRGHSLLAA
jgi:hypothetical protein